MLIQNYGLFWREDYVFWGHQKKSGQLLGRNSSGSASSVVDFREQTGVYVLYKDYTILYVGQAGNGKQKLFVRLRRHRTDPLAKRWNQFSWFGTRRVNKNGHLSYQVAIKRSAVKDVLNHLEAALIEAAEPPLNKQGGKFGRKVNEYLQVRDVRLGMTSEEMIKQLWEAHKENGP